MDDLKGKTAIVTGASRGIGAATARELAGLGVNVVLVARSEGEIAGIADEIVKAGGKAAAVALDVARYVDVRAAADTAVERFGRLDILVNNAGLIEPIAHLAESDPAAWNLVVDVNLKGVYHGLRAALPVMVGQGAGVVVNISSCLLYTSDAADDN